MNNFKVTIAGDFRKGVNPTNGEEWTVQDVVLVETDPTNTEHPNSLAVAVWNNNQPLVKDQAVSGQLSFSVRSYKDKNGNTRYSTNVSINLKPF